MRAAIYQNLDLPLEIVSVADPKPQPDQVIVEVVHAGICGSDLHMKQWGHAVPGTIFGHEFADTIVGEGSGVGLGWKTGERVTALPIDATAFAVLFGSPRHGAIGEMLVDALNGAQRTKVEDGALVELIEILVDVFEDSIDWLDARAFGE